MLALDLPDVVLLDVLVLEHAQTPARVLAVHGFLREHVPAPLRRLPVGRIKIDRSFIADPSNLKRDGAIVRALVSLAHGLDLKVLVEGVETEEQLRFCERAHCDLMQGYYFAPPLPPESCARMLSGDEAERMRGESAA